MQVFVTGGTGLIGKAVVAELIAHGHSVLGLARSEASAQALEKAGARPLRGGLADLDILAAGAREAEGVINLAFDHDFTSADGLMRSIAEETAALATLGQALLGTGRPLVTAAATPQVPGRLSTENDPVSTEGAVGGRGRAVSGLLALATQGVRSVAVRLPRTVHNEGKGGFAGILARLAQQKGIAAYPGEGTQRWPAVHALDAAVLFRLALERAEAGTAWHAVADEGDAVRDIVTVIGRRLGLPVASLPAESFGPFAPIFMLDQPSSSVLTQEGLGWKPVHPGLLDDLENL